MPVVTTALAGAAGLIACAFTLSSLDRWLRRRAPHELAWTVAMALFAVASLALWWAESTGWTMLVFRVFFLCGAVLNVAWLSLGTIYLLAGKRLGDISRTLLIAMTGLATGVIVTSPAKTAIVANEFPTGREVFGIFPRILAVVGSGVPALIIIMGALFSTWRVLRKKSPALLSGVARHVISPRRLAASNLLITAGTLTLSASGTLAGRLGKDRAFAITLLIGVCILFAGFLVASSSKRARFA